MTSPTDLPTQGFTSLDELCDALNRIVRDEYDLALAWDWRLPRDERGQPDIFALPTFDPTTRAPLPYNGAVFSWDDTRMIVRDYPDTERFTIVPRPDLPAQETPAPTSPTSHTLVVIGYTGAKRAYLDIGFAAAVARYEREYNDGEPVDQRLVKEFTFTDGFNVYDAWED